METPNTSPALTAAVPRPSPARGNWLVSPLVDLFFLANVGWLLALIPGFAAADGTTPVTFWQLYFLTVPHRWATLALVAFDPDRREGRGRLFMGLAVGAFLLIVGVRLVTSAFLCLLLVDFVWNSWHFASQHAGVLRMYARKAGTVGNPRLERNGLRFFLMYVLLRAVDWSTGWLDKIPGAADFVGYLDLLVLGVPLLLLVREMRTPGTEVQPHPTAAAWNARPGKRVFLLSVCSLYSLLLLSVNWRWHSMVLALTFAVAWFHAAEYLAVVTLYARQRQNQGSAGLARQLARNWLWLLAGFILLLGSVAVVSDKNWRGFWLGLNLWASLLHYAYDGMIWKLRRPATAQALGVGGTVPAASPQSAA